MPTDAPNAKAEMMAPTPPMSVTAKKNHSAGDQRSEHTRADRRAILPSPDVAHQSLRTGGASSERHNHHGISTNIAFPDDVSDSFDNEELDQVLSGLQDPLTDPLPSVTIDDLIDERLFLGDIYDENEGVADKCRDPNADRPQPPSSVVRGFDRESRSLDEFDPNLQHSPPQSSSTISSASPGELPLLTDDTDWAYVQAGPDIIQRDPTAQPSGVMMLTPAASAPYKVAREPTQSQGQSQPKPFKTFFHFSEMLETKIDLFKNQPLVVFELYARVLYSSRENFFRKQYFQFRDLFKETPPYLSGALLG